MHPLVRWPLVVVTVVGLAIDAYNHLNVASNYAANATSTVSEAALFRVEGVLAILAAVAVIIWANRWTAAAAFLVAGGGLFLLLLYRYVDVGTIGPLPDMYEPTFEVPGKKWSIVGEVIAIVGSLGLFAATLVRPTRVRQRQPVPAGRQ